MYLKFCGFTQEEDIREAVQHDIQAVGFITYPKSARYVDLAQLQNQLRTFLKRWIAWQ